MHMIRVVKLLKLSLRIGKHTTGSRIIKIDNSLYHIIISNIMFNSSINLQCHNFQNTLNVRLTHEDAKVPMRGTPDSAGYDLYALMGGVVPPRGKSIVRTGICIQMPVPPCPYLRLYGSIRSRSGLSAKHDIEVGAGVIDNGYTDEIKVILRNNSDTEFNYEQGDRIAQLVIEVFWQTDDVKVVDYIPPTSRTGGFGSTGLK